jgi:2-polyprenyl-3-methyl-5-hydroxy-6-metoxy-1,4-benzoquinol methylase
VSEHPQFGKIYFREFEPDGSLAKVAAMVPRGATVLDIGAGPGILGQHLRDKRACTVDGIEGNPEAARHAEPFYRTLVVGNLESARLSELFGGRKYDAIICADVLEHLRDPSYVLAQLSALLTDEGRILISLPNVAYAGVIAELLDGDFRYRPDGLLDRTHVRFFARRTLTRWLDEHGLRVVLADDVVRDHRSSEFAPELFERLPPSVARQLLSRPDALTYQFVVAVAPKRAGADDPPAPVAMTASEQALAAMGQFDARLYWRPIGEAFSQAASVRAAGAVGVERQTLRFVIPPPPRPLEQLRFDPAERPGYLRLYEIVLRDADGVPCWRWKGRLDELESLATGQISFAVAQGESGGVVALLEGDDPAIELPLDARALEKLSRGGELTVDCSWPMSSDYWALIARKLASRAG